jgi:hypothetical protein
MLLTLGAIAAAGVAYADRPTDVCRRWAADRVDRNEGTWTGNADACMAGDVTEPGRTNALKILNLYRSSPRCGGHDRAGVQRESPAVRAHAGQWRASHTPPTT